MLEYCRIMRAYLAADSILQGRDDFASPRVIFRVGGENQHEIERKAHGIAFDLNIAFLHDVEQPYLDFAREIGQLVNGEDAAIRARNQAIVDGQFVCNVLTAAGSLD